MLRTLFADMAERSGLTPAIADDPPMQTIAGSRDARE